MSAFIVTLQGGAPWGLRLQGGSGTGQPLRIAKINPGSKAARAQLHVGDIVETVNGVRTGELPLTQAQKLLHNNTNDLQLRIHRSQTSLNGSLHPKGTMSQSSFIVTNDSGFSGTGSPTSPPMSLTNGYPMNTQAQKGWVLADMTTGFLPKSRGAALFERRKKLQEARDRGEELPPPMVDIPYNNNNFHKDEDEFWPPPPPPDESIWSPTKGSPPSNFPGGEFDAPPPPPSLTSAPVWTPSGSQPVKKEFKPVKPDLTPKERPKTSTVRAPTFSAPPSAAPHSWAPPGQPAPPASSAPHAPQYSQPMTVDTLPDPSHILSPSYVSPRSPSQPPAPAPPPPAHNAPVAGGDRPTPTSPSGRAVPYSQGAPVPVEGMPNGYGFIPADAVMSGSPHALQTDPTSLPPGALFQKQTIEGDVMHTDTFYPVQNVTRKTSTVVKHEAPNYEGIGPRDKDGLPLGLRQHVKEDKRKDWYKEMFKSIHKQDQDEDDFDDNTSQNVEDAWKSVSGSRNDEPETVVKSTPSYRVQPGRITDFAPGKSALAEHERALQAHRDGPAYEVRRHSATGSGYASDEDARKAYRNFVKSGQLPSQGLGLGAPPARRDHHKTPSAGPLQQQPPPPPSSSLQAPSYQPQQQQPQQYQQSPPPSSSAASVSSLSSPARPSPTWSGGGGGGRGQGGVPLGRSASLSRTTGLPRRKQRYSEGGSGLSAAERLGIKTPPPARLSASSATKPTPAPDSRYDYMNQFHPPDRQNSERKPKEVREPDASYKTSLPEYNPVKSPAISDDRFDDFDFTPAITVPVAKQEITKASAIALYPFTAQTKKELSFKKGDTIYLTREIDKNWLEGEHHGNKGIFPRSYVEIVTSIEEARSLQVSSVTAEGKGRARYKFKGETANEISVNKGEIVDLVRKVDANWWEVRHGNKAGIVPVAYLEVLREPQQGPTSPQPRSPLSSGPGLGSSPLSPTLSSGGGPPRSPSSVSSYQSQQQPGPQRGGAPSSDRMQNRGRAPPAQQSGRGDARGRPTQNASHHQKYPDGERFRAVYGYQPSNDDELELMEGEMVVVMEKCDDGWFVGFSESSGQFGTFPGNYVEKL